MKTAQIIMFPSHRSSNLPALERRLNDLTARYQGDMRIVRTRLAYLRQRKAAILPRPILIMIGVKRLQEALLERKRTLIQLIDTFEAVQTIKAVRAAQVRA